MLLPGNFIYTKDTIDKEERTSIWGYRAKMIQYSSGTYDSLSYSPLDGKDGISDIRAHRWPLPEILDFSHFSNESRSHTDRAVIGVFTWGAFFIACYVRGMESLMMDFAIRRDYVDYLLRRINEISAESLRTMLRDHGESIDIVFMCDDYCSQLAPLISPSDFSEFVMPYLRELVDITHKYDKKFLLHVCGSVRQLLPMIIDAGVDLLEPIQIRAAGMDPAGLKKDFGQDICF
jgi:uroporphyrinogen decarboxylase